jgi:hypothetical protein
VTGLMASLVAGLAAGLKWICWWIGRQKLACLVVVGRQAGQLCEPQLGRLLKDGKQCPFVHEV